MAAPGVGPPGGTAERVLQRVILPADADRDILPLYIESALTTVAPEVSDSAGTGAEEEAPQQTQGSPLSAGRIVTGRHSASVDEGQAVSFGSYFNAFPAGYWQRWTTLRSVTLRLTLFGRGEVTVHRSTAKGHVMRVAARQVDSRQPTTIDFDLPLTNFIDGGWYWFDLTADVAALQLVSGDWVGTTDRTTTGTLSIGITTFNRPTFCLDLLEALAGQETVLDVIDEILVVDQGSKKLADHPRFPGIEHRLRSRLRVLEQPNLGGSGGFSRAMDEVVTKGASTYCLLLDDDVVCEPDGILRALTFADLARRPTIVGGQMLSLYDRCVLHAFGESVAQYRWFWGPSPGTYHSMDFTRRSLRATPWLHRRIDVDYNGWWMCLVPTEVIRDVGLSVPMFIKWDDAEYGLRARAAGHPTVTLPGVTVWHVPWHEKDDTLDWQAYFHRRNRIVSALLHSPYERGGRLITESFQTQIKHLLAMQYSAAEMGVLAIEDVLEGPDRLHRDVARRLPELKQLGLDHADSRKSQDLEDFPAVRRPKPPRKGKSPTAPSGSAALLRSAGLGMLRQLKPVRETSRQNPEIAVPHVFQTWWRLAQADSALVSSADGAGAAWYQRDAEQFRSLLRRSVDVHLLLWRRWSTLSETYRASLPDVSSPGAWRRTFEQADQPEATAGVSDRQPGPAEQS